MGGRIVTDFKSDGRKKSTIENNACVVQSAIQLADKEEQEDIQAEKKNCSPFPEKKDYSGGDRVVIIEGDNCGLFGTLQRKPPGIFDAFTFPPVVHVKEDEDGYFGVDVDLNPGTEFACTEGFWIHPDALYHKKYEIGHEVYIIDGVNAGKYGAIQGQNGRLVFDKGCYGVDVKTQDGGSDGYWVHPKSMQPAKESPEFKKLKEEQEKQEKEEEEDLSEIDKFEF